MSFVIALSAKKKNNNTKKRWDMLQQLTIRNFQKHRKLSIQFDKHCTTLVGASDKGKSAVIRALRWLFWNKPSGSSFIRHGSKGVKVEAIIDDRKITRRKGKENTYTLDGKRFAAFGTNVPDEISNLVNVDDTNIQRQHEAPFWFMLSAGEASKELNRIINLGLIDQTLANLASDLRRSKAAVEVSEQRLAEARERRDELKWTEQAKQDLDAVQLVETDLVSTKESTARLRWLTSEGSRLRGIAQNAAGAGVVCRSLCSATEQEQQKQERINKLQEAIVQTERIERKRDSIRKTYNEYRQKLETIKVCPICNMPYKPRQSAERRRAETETLSGEVSK